ncbi:MAG: Tn3 family transposase [Chloroflexota bacterium]
MARNTILTQRQREQVMAFPHPDDVRLIARFYLFSEQDMQIIQQQGTDSHQFAFALHLCVLRYPGRIWQINEQLPDYLINLVSEQLALPISVLDGYQHDYGTRRSQLYRLRQRFGFHLFDDTTKQHLRDWMMTSARSTDKAIVLMNILLAKMRDEQVVIPALSLLENFLHGIIQNVNHQTYQALASSLSDDQRTRLHLLLSNRDETGKSYAHWVQQPAGTATINNLLVILDRLTFLKAMKLGTANDYAVNANRLHQLARRCERLSVWHLRDLRNSTERDALLVAFALRSQSTLIDQALNLFIRLYQGVFKRAQTSYSERFFADGKTINQHLHQYVALGKLVIAARQHQRDVFQQIDEAFSWETFVADIEQAETLMRPPNFDFLTLVGNRYSHVRRFSPHFLQAFVFQGHEETADIRQAIQLICDVDTGKRAHLPEWAPTDFVDERWQPYVFQDGDLQRRYYELCVLDKLRDGLRSGDIWVAGSDQFRPLKSFLIPDAQWQTMLDADVIPVAVPRNPITYLSVSHQALHQQIQQVDEGLANGAFEDVEWINNRLKIARTRLDIPADMAKVRRAVYSLLPRIRITDLLLEVDASVGFTQQFTHLQTDEPFDNPLALCTTLLAGAINLGIEKMALASHHTHYDRLAWIADWFIRDDTYARALTQLTHFQMANPFAYHWGSATRSSSDAQYFPTGAFQSAATSHNPYYGKESGIAFYTHVSDQHSPFYTQVISTRVREAPYMLNGLLHHDTQLDIHEHATDTKGFTDHVFALCHLLGFRFAPRIRSFNKLKLYPIKHARHYPTLKPILGARINTRLIYDDWIEMLHIASSLRLGTVTPPVFLQRLAHYPRQNRWAKTLKEIGRLERTFFALHWIQDKLMRQQVHQALYKGEARNALSRAVCIHRLGRIHDRSLQDQHYRASALNLVVSAIAIWNTIYIEKAVEHLRHQGWAITDKHLEHLTPLGWEHISLTGDYIWNPNLSTNLTNLRDLRV